MENKRILIFGGSGSLGLSLINRLIDKNKILVYSRDEAKHWNIKNKIKNKNLSLVIGDIRDYQRVKEEIVKYKPDIIIIVSALKHVDICELFPKESILTNINGPQNVIDIITDKIEMLQNLEVVLMVSTDKACSPINIYGMCKSISERIVIEKGRHFNKVKFLVVRYGNVLQSRGSIIPLFMYQAKNDPFFTLTRSDMTRFLMTLDESVDLIIDIIKNGASGESWIPKLRSMRIEDLANIFSKVYNKPVKEVGIRSGEKIHEYLINQTESLRSIITEKHYIIKPIYENKIYNNKPYDYDSSIDILDYKNLFEYLKLLNVFKEDIDNFVI